MKQTTPQLPTFDAMMLPTLQALQMLGGSGTTDEIYAKVAQILGLPNEVLEVPHGDTSGSEVEYRLAWSRTYLKKYGLIDNSARGVWSLTSTNLDFSSLDPKEIVRTVREQVARQTLAMPSAQLPIWGAYLAVDQRTRAVVGSCGFKGGPTPEGVVEIAYFTFPAYEGRGYASVMAQALMDLVWSAPAVRRVIAHTLAERNASARVLEKVRMHCIGQVIDPQDGRVWRWERERERQSSDSARCA
jgi:RimJ/RimL family protein N-acetyltransferase